MKTIALTLVVLLTGLFGPEIEESPVAPVTGTNVLLVNKTYFKGSFRLTVKNSAGRTVSKKQYRRKKSGQRLLNLDRLPVGNYTLLTEDTYKLSTTPFEVTDEGIIMDSNSLRSYSKPNFGFKKGAFRLTYHAQKKAVEVVIKNDLGTVMYRETILKQDQIHRRYRFPNLSPGIYTMGLTSEKHQFSERIKVY